MNSSSLGDAFFDLPNRTFTQAIEQLFSIDIKELKRRADDGDIVAHLNYGRCLIQKLGLAVNQSLRIKDTQQDKGIMPGFEPKVSCQ
jgi:hypothetical protein